jgi:hypothetical protein
MVGALVALLVGVAAEASSISIYMDPTAGHSAENTGATALVILDFADGVDEDFLTITIENTTPEEIGSSLTGVGLELPDSLSLSPALLDISPSEYFDTLSFDQSLPPPVWIDAPGGYDLALSSDGDLGGGNTGGAPLAGETQIVMLSLGDTGQTAAALEQAFRGFYKSTPDNFAVVRFQAVGPDGEDSDKVTGVVPEPATLALLALGGLAIGRRRHRRR